MKITSLYIKNFRNLQPGLKLDFESGINLILGQNGSGKTNLLESLSILSGWGAFSRTKNLITWDNPSQNALISAKISGEENFTITANISSKISIKLFDKPISCTDLRLILPSMIFLTSDVNLIDSSPAARRLFIDRLCALFVPVYAKKLSDFKFISRKRAALLKENKSPDSTSILFCQLGGFIMSTRRKVLNLLCELFPPDKLLLEFLPVIKPDSCEKYLQEFIKRESFRERKAQRVICGPSFDELAINLADSNRPAADSLSRGQKRRLILYIIITAGKLIESRLKRAPILLLDDFTSELDSQGREFVQSELIKTGWQIFITAPERPFKTTKHNNIFSFIIH